MAAVDVQRHGDFGRTQARVAPYCTRKPPYRRKLLILNCRRGWDSERLSHSKQA
jgi:hypothetical protein